MSEFLYTYQPQLVPLALHLRGRRLMRRLCVQLRGLRCCLGGPQSDGVAGLQLRPQRALGRRDRGSLALLELGVGVLLRNMHD